MSHNINELPLWVEIIVALLLLGSGALALIGAIGLLRLKTFFQRMHAPAVTTSLCIWCVALAAIVYFSARESRLGLQAWLILILLAITAPITTSLLARAALFRQRTTAKGEEAPAEDARG